MQHSPENGKKRKHQNEIPFNQHYVTGHSECKKFFIRVYQDINDDVTPCTWRVSLQRSAQNRVGVGSRPPTNIEAGHVGGSGFRAWAAKLSPYSIYSFHVYLISLNAQIQAHFNVIFLICDLLKTTRPNCESGARECFFTFSKYSPRRYPYRQILKFTHPDVYNLYSHRKIVAQLFRSSKFKSPREMHTRTLSPVLKGKTNGLKQYT